MNRKFAMANTNIDLIQRAINYSSWERFQVEKDVNEKVYIYC